MTDEQILTKAIEKALASGWTMFGFAGLLKSWNVLEQESSYQSWLYGRMDERPIYQLRVSLNDVLYNHNFVRGFWAENEVFTYAVKDWTKNLHTFRTIEAWQYHLQQMVLEESPLQYLAKFL